MFTGAIGRPQHAQIAWPEATKGPGLTERLVSRAVTACADPGSRDNGATVAHLLKREGKSVGTDPASRPC
jgi:hypothetical protein